MRPASDAAMPSRLVLSAAIALTLAACGGGASSAKPTTGGGGSSGGSSGGGGGGPTLGTWVVHEPGTVVAPIPLRDTTHPDHTIVVGADLAAAVAELRTAMASSGVIVFATGGSDVVLPLTQQLEVPQQVSVVIDGGDHVTLDGGHACRIVHKGWKSDLVLQRLTLRNGDATGYAGADDTARSGGALNVDTWDGSLSVLACRFEGCRAVQDGPDCGGGAIRALGQRRFEVSGCRFTGCSAANGGAIVSLGSRLLVVDSVFSDDHAVSTVAGTGAGGAIYVDGVYQNGEQHRLDIGGCSFTDGSATGLGGAVFAILYDGTASAGAIGSCLFARDAHLSADGGAGAVYLQGGDLTITGSTFSDDRSAGIVGALWITTGERARLADCTFAGNRAEVGTGALWLEGAVWMSNCTVAGNSAAHWPGGVRVGFANAVRMKNCLLSANAVTDVTLEDQYNGWNISAPVGDGGGNLQWPRQRGSTHQDDTLMTPTALVRDPLLQSLGDNGGPTPTMAPAGGSPAIDGGVDAQCPDSDQRGEPRSGRCDIGAVEVQPPAPLGGG